MDSDRRHQLGQNDLLNWLLDCYEDVLRPNVTLILAGVAVGVVLVGSFVLYSRTAAAAQRAGWDNYFRACRSGNAEASLEMMATHYTSGEMGALVRLTLAEAMLNSATQLALTKKAETRELLGKVGQNLSTAATLTSDVATQERILYARGIMHETLCAVSATEEESQRDRDAAITAFRNLAAQYIDGVYTQAAQSRLQSLERNLTQNLLVAFAVTPIVEPEKTAPLGIDINTSEAPEKTDSLDLDKILE